MKNESQNNSTYARRGAGRLGVAQGGENQPKVSPIPKCRTAFYVDCFNLYHAVKRNLPEARWTSIYHLLQQFFIGDQSELVSIKLFTTKPSHISATQTARHELFEATQSLQSDKVQVVSGRFKRKEIYCGQCECLITKHEEKQTDVNLAVHILSDAYRGLVDKIYILSGDTDFVPIIRELERSNLVQRVKLILPIGVNPPLELTEAMVSFCSSKKTKPSEQIISLREAHFSASTRLPDEFVDNEGNLYKNPYKPELHGKPCDCFVCKKLPQGSMSRK